MPELPEVEAARQRIESVAVGRGIIRIICADDRIVFDERSPAACRSALRGRVVRAVERRGKYLWWRLADTGPHPLFHLGMSGGFHVRGETPMKLVAHGRKGPDVWPPRFIKMHVTLDDGGEVIMVDPRRFGRIRLRDEPTEGHPIASLGFDPLIDPLSPASFRAAVRRRAAPIKAVLLDQSFAAGVGNWIADEVLYQARIDPRRRANTLSDDEVLSIRRALSMVIRTAVRVGADKSRFPKTWLFHVRWGKAVGAATADGHPITHTTIGGRTTAWVPAVQR